MITLKEHVKQNCIGYLWHHGWDFSIHLYGERKVATALRAKYRKIAKFDDATPGEKALNHVVDTWCEKEGIPETEPVLQYIV